MRSLFAGALALAACIAASPVQATTIADPSGDFLPTFIGPNNGDLDVVSFSAKLVGTDFLLSAMMDADLGLTPGAIYVVGVNRGGAGAPFAPNGLPGVLFNSVVILMPDATGVVNLIPGATPLAAGAVTVSGDTISALVPLSLLPSTGFTPDQYGFSIWPRLATGDFTSIADFAPNDSTIAVVPEPGAWALMLLGFGALGAMIRWRRRSVPATA